MFSSNLVLFFSVIALTTVDGNGESASKVNLIDWEPPEWVKTKFPYFHSGYDYDDIPVIIQHWGKWDTLEVVSKGGEDLRILDNYFDQFCGRISNGFYKKNNSDAGADSGSSIVLIVDYDGLQSNQLSSHENVIYQIGFNKKINSIVDHVAYGFYINVNPFGDFLLNTAKSSISRLIEVMETHGTNREKWMPILLRKIPQNQLPPEYGGDKDFKPVQHFG